MTFGEGTWEEKLRRRREEEQARVTSPEPREREDVAPDPREEAPTPSRAIAKAATEGDERKLKVRSASRLYGVPGNFIILFRGADNIDRPYLLKDGVMFLLKQRGYRAIQVAVEPDAVTGGWTAEARIFPNPTPEDYSLLNKLAEKGDSETFRKTFEEVTRPTIAHASANDANVRVGSMKAYLKELCETRAVLRCGRLYLGVGIPTREEESEPGAEAA